MHGYELRKRLNATLGAFRAFSYGSLYPCLKSLLAAGLVSEQVDAPAVLGKRSRIVYQLTAEGKEHFATLLDESGPSAWDDEGFGVHFAFFGRTDAQTRLRILEGRRSRLEERVDGFRAALESGADVVASMDCDFSHDPSALPSLLAATAEADLVIGSRYVEGGAIRNWGVYRTRLSATANTFVRALFRLPVHDCTSGFRAYRREVVEGIPWTRLHSTGYSFLVEILYWSARAGRRVREVPITYVDRARGKSKMGLRQIVSGASNLIKLRLELARGR
jgi:DNA-binding PadR family transcriptional regulator